MNNNNPNELPDVEVLGEWDHGICDPIQEPESTTRTKKRSSTCQDLKAAVIQVEQVVEGAAKVACRKADHVVRDVMNTCVGALGPDRRHVDEEPDVVVDRNEWMNMALLVERS